MSTLYRRGLNNTSGPYVSPAATEHFPLRGHCRDSKCISMGDGFKLIIACFIVAAFIVTVALLIQIRFGQPQVVIHGAVVSDSVPCSQVGEFILNVGGSAVDAAVAITFCMGVVHPHVTGVGGGGFMTIYNDRDKSCKVIDFRETAPSSAVREVYELNPKFASFGGLAIGVPGFVQGLEVAHQMYGKLPWKDLLQPSITLAKEGFTISQHLLKATENYLDAGELRNIENLFDFIPEMPWTSTTHVKRSALAQLMEKISVNKSKGFYEGPIAEGIVSSLNDQKFSISLSDINNYKAYFEDGIVSTFLQYTVCTSGPPSGGPQLLAALNILERMNVTSNITDRVSLIHWALEASRLTASYQAQLGDPSILPMIVNQTQTMISKDEAADMQKQISDMEVLPARAVVEVPELVGSHVVTTDNQDIYVSVVSGLGDFFGSKVVAPHSILLNNAMADFSLPIIPSTFTNDLTTNNIVHPGQRPLSKYAPTILRETDFVCGRRLATGAADASLAAEVLLNWVTSFNELDTSVEKPRVVAKASSTVLRQEDDRLHKLPQAVMAALQHLGYTFQPIKEPYLSVNMIERVGDGFTAYADTRGGGIEKVF